MLFILRTGYFGSSESLWRNQVRIVFRDNPVCFDIARSDNPSRRCIRLIFANMPTVITPDSPLKY